MLLVSLSCTCLLSGKGSLPPAAETEKMKYKSLWPQKVLKAILLVGEWVFCLFFVFWQVLPIIGSVTFWMGQADTYLLLSWEGRMI